MKKQLNIFYIFLLMTIVLSTNIGVQRVFATTTKTEETRTVKVAFFPMNGYHITYADGVLGGMDVEYLRGLNQYLNWKIEFVPCDSWEDALARVKSKELDLVGSAQYSPERDKEFDFAALASGYTFGSVVTKGDSEVAYQDFDKMRTLKYGMVDGYVREPEFLSYMADHGIEEVFVEKYASTSEMKQALESGEVDAYVHTFTEIDSGQRLIGRFAPAPFYYMTWDGNTELISELNLALADLNMNQPNLATILMNQYYYNQLDKTVLYKTEELQYADKAGAIRVGYLPECYPLSYETDGEFDGLARRELDKVSRETGLQFVYKRMNTPMEAKEALKDRRIDMLAYYACTEKEIHDDQLYFMDPYAEIPLVLLTKKGNYDGDIKRLGTELILSNSASSILNVDDTKVRTFASQKICMDQLAEGKVDAVLGDGYMAEYHLRTSTNYEDITISRVLSESYHIHRVIRADMDPLFISMMERSRFTIDSKAISAYMLERNEYKKIGIRVIWERHNEIIILGMWILLVAVILVARHMIKDGRKIQKLMYKDEYLNVWNINYFFYWSEQKLIKDHMKYAVVSVNLMQFRRYNVVYGWTAGQRLLGVVIKTLKEMVDKDRELYARNQGDRFVMLLEVQEMPELMERLRYIKKEIERRVYKETENNITIRMGVCILPEEKPDIRIATNHSTQALELMEDGGDIRVYDDEFEEQIRERHERERKLDAVSIDDDFVVYYQNKVDIRTEQIVGAEALVRFKDPASDGMIRAPYYFVPYYEQTGQIADIDFFVLKKVCQMLRRRMDEGKKVVPISVNFSRIHFIRNGFPEQFEKILNEYNIPKELVEVEITETLVVEELQQRLIKQNIDALQEQGVRLSIDDFGTGYSSLGVFEQIPASVVKLDRSFLLNKEDHKRQVAIMRGIVNMTRDLGAQIVCEGVETEDDIELMKEIDAHVAQGYFYSRPIDEASFETKLDN